MQQGAGNGTPGLARGLRWLGEGAVDLALLGVALGSRRAKQRGRALAAVAGVTGALALDVLWNRQPGGARRRLSPPKHTLTVNKPRDEAYALWRTLPVSYAGRYGAVTFEAAPNGRGTVVSVEIAKKPAGIGDAVAEIFSDDPGRQVREDLRRFKQRLETGEVPTTEGQPSGPRTGLLATAKSLVASR
jgi:uncharacterized membrane protein